MTPLDGSCEATYEDGYVHSATLLGDVSLFVEGKNVFDDILHKRPEAEHGKMIKFTGFYNNTRYDIDWVGLPENAKPVWFKNMSGEFAPDGKMANVQIVSVGIGYQYLDTTGKNVQEIQVV